MTRYILVIFLLGLVFSLGGLSGNGTSADERNNATGDNMQTTTYIKGGIITASQPGDGKRVLFILGWGVTLEDVGIKWFAEQAAKERWNMVTVQLPNTYSSYEKILEQISAVCSKHQPEAIISFSMGSLYAAWLNAPARVFISPYWGNNPKKLVLHSLGFSRFLMCSLSFINSPLIPRGYTKEDIGTIDVSDLIPQKMAPSTVHQVLLAQAKRPPALPTDHIFYYPKDVIIDRSLCTGAIMHTFEGGHDFMATPDRESVFTKLAEIVAQ
jgi:hypothetical protein